MHHTFSVCTHTHGGGSSNDDGNDDSSSSGGDGGDDDGGGGGGGGGWFGLDWFRLVCIVSQSTCSAETAVDQCVKHSHTIDVYPSAASSRLNETVNTQHETARYGTAHTVGIEKAYASNARTVFHVHSTE